MSKALRVIAANGIPNADDVFHLDKMRPSAAERAGFQVAHEKALLPNAYPSGSRYSSGHAPWS